MSRYLLLVLLLAASVALADNRREAQPAAGAAEAQAKTEPAQAPTEEAQKQTEEAQAKTQAATEAAQGRTEHAPAETAEAQTEETQAKTDEDAKLISVPGGKALGMSILGNQDAPKALVIVPWKSSELGDSPGISTMLDDSRQPVDKEVFIRALRYYEIRSETKP